MLEQTQITVYTATAWTKLLFKLWSLLCALRMHWYLGFEYHIYASTTAPHVGVSQQNLNIIYIHMIQAYISLPFSLEHGINASFKSEY